MSKAEIIPDDFKGSVISDDQLIGIYQKYWENAVLMQPEEHKEVFKTLTRNSTSPKAQAWLGLAKSLFYTFFPSEGNAFESLTDAQNKFQAIGDEDGFGASKTMLALYYKNVGQLENASRSVIEAILKTGKDSVYNYFLTIAYYQSGEIHHTLKEYKTAIEHFEKGLTLPDSKGSIHSRLLNGIGSVYLDSNQLDLALEYFNKSLSSLKDKNNPLLETKNYSDIGKYYEKTGDFKRAGEYYLRSLELRKEKHYNNPLITSYTDLAILYVKLNEPDQALKFAMEALNLAESLNIQLKLPAVHLIMSEIYEIKKDPISALEHYKTYTSLKEEIYNQENAKIISQLTLQHQIENMQKENEIFTLRNVELKNANDALQKSIETVEKERQRSETLLLNILPPNVADELKQNGNYKARHYQKVHVLFSDFCGFTKTAQSMSAEELVSELNTCFSAFDLITEKYQIEKIKTIGDSYFAVNGLSKKDSHKNLVLAALEMQQYIQKRVTERMAEMKPCFTMRVGIHSGPVIAGIVGYKKFQYDIWGDTVNTASRMESSGEPGKVNISENMYNLLKNDPDLTFEYRGEILAKSKGQMKMWFVSARTQ